MGFKYYGKSKKSKMSKAKRTVNWKKSKAQKPTVALIKSVLAQEIETKFRSQAPVINVAYNGQITNSDLISLVPTLYQASTSDPSTAYERQAMRVSPKKLTCEFMVNITKDLARSTNVVVCWYALTHKSTKHFPDLSVNQDISDSLFRTGDSNMTYGFDGIYLNSTFPVNDAEYKVLKRGKILLGKNTGQIQDSTTAGNQPVYGNHTCKIVRFNIKCPEKLIYEQDKFTPRTVAYPTNFAPFIVFGYFHQDQTPFDLVNQDISVTLRQSLWFDDA